MEVNERYRGKAKAPKRSKVMLCRTAAQIRMAEIAAFINGPEARNRIILI